MQVLVCCTLLYCSLVAIVFLTINYRLRKALKCANTSLDSYINIGTLPTHDVTHFHGIARELLGKVQITIKTLDATLNEKKDLVTLMSHDMRTPLAQVIGMCSLIKLTDDKQEIDEYCQILMNEMTNQLNFLEQVVRMNRLDSMDAAFRDRKMVHISELVDRAMHSLNVQTVEKPLEWQFQIENTSVFVNGHLFAQALQNVISNAIKFSKEDSSISISSHKDQNKTVIEIQDHGLGFLQKDAGALFNRFTEKGKAGTLGEKSNGIGLYLTRNIIERHNGIIEAFSPGPGEGATFRITLPA